MSLSYEWFNVYNIYVNDEREQTLKDQPLLLHNLTQSNTVVTEREGKSEDNIIHFQKSVPFTFGINIDYLVRIIKAFSILKLLYRK